MKRAALLALLVLAPALPARAEVRLSVQPVLDLHARDRVLLAVEVRNDHEPRELVLVGQVRQETALPASELHLKMAPGGRKQVLLPILSAGPFHEFDVQILEDDEPRASAVVRVPAISMDRYLVA